jgi:hypothetical protein
LPWILARYASVVPGHASDLVCVVGNHRTKDWFLLLLLLFSSVMAWNDATCRSSSRIVTPRILTIYGRWFKNKIFD